MPKVIVVGGGAGGCAAAIAARKAGAEVILIERTDRLFGGANRAGRMNNNGRMVAAEELKALGGAEIHEALESITLHYNHFSDEENTYTYHCGVCEPAIRKVIEDKRITILYESRAIGVRKECDRIVSVSLEDGTEIEGDSFVDATGTSGGIPVCQMYGKGCVMCVCYRCHVFGNRVSIATKGGAPMFHKLRPDGTPGALGAAISIFKESLSDELRAELEEKRAMRIPLPTSLIDYSKLVTLGASRTKEDMENINLVDIGISAKCIGLGYLPLDSLRKIPGFEKAYLEDPPGGGVFNKIGKIDMTVTDESLKVEGFHNLFACGEKMGIGGVSEVIISGYLAGHNAVRIMTDSLPIALPKATVIGGYLSYVVEKAKDPINFPSGFSLAHGILFDRVKERGLYPSTPSDVRRRIGEEGLSNIFGQKIT